MLLNEPVHNPAATDSNHQALRAFEQFLSMTDRGSLWVGTDAESLRLLRQEVAATLHRLLVWERPWLEAQRSILWPYQELAKRFRSFQQLAEDATDLFRHQQAQLFLALLPFPRQWQWLLQVERRFGSISELQSFLTAEARSVADKIEHKPQNAYKLRHFCQVLKGYRGAREKGILRIFSIPYLLVALHPQMLSRISARYVIFAEPPMGILFRHTWWRHYTNLADPCVIGIASPEDRAFLQQQASVEVAPLAHGDFLNDREPEETGTRKDYAIVFNATFDDMPRKRHGLMLELLRHPLLIEAKTLFLGRGRDENIAALDRRVRQLGLENRVTIVANVRREEVPALLARCRMGVHLSLYENACRSIYEFFRADLPCVISSTMAGMNPEIFNDQTGIAVSDVDLPEAIDSTLQHPERFAPRRWFLEHSGSRHSSRRLNEVFRTLFSRWGYEWHEDIVALASSGANRYADASDYERFRNDFRWLLDCLQQATARPSLFTLE
jgi:glycosyltransferase involved in cell wall biosynthesis